MLTVWTLERWAAELLRPAAHHGQGRAQPQPALRQEHENPLD